MSEQKQRRFPKLPEIIRRIAQNWPFKLAALAIALVLWSGLILQDATLTRERVFNNVSVSVSGAETMKRNGYIVVSGTSDLRSGVQLRVDVPQLQYQTVQSSNYSPRIDLSRINSTGKQSVRILTTSTTTYGTVREVSPATVEIEVEEYVTRYRIPVVITTTGEVPEGYYASSPSIDPPLVTISGPKSQVEAVVRAEATLDLSTLPARDGAVSSAAPLKLIKSDGSTVESSLVEITNQSVLLDSIVTEQTMYPVREMTLNTVSLVSGTPADGYEIKSVTVSPVTFRAAAKRDVLEELTELFTDTTLSVENATQSVSGTLKLHRPNELAYLSNDSVTVAVEIGPVTATRVWDDARITYTGLQSGLTASLGTKTASVSITGRKLWLQSLESDAIHVQLDLSEYTEPGEYDVPVTAYVTMTEGDVRISCAVDTVHVTIK